MIRVTRLTAGCRIWPWFILLSIPIGLLAALLSGNLQVRRNPRAGVPLEEFTAHMRASVPALMKRHGIPGCCIALVKGREVVWTEAYGYADAAGGRALTADTPMSVQSITKSVTAWGVMRLAEKGQIDLDAPVTKYLKSWRFPQSDYPAEKITSRRLLSHTAGLPLGDFTDIYSPGEAMPSNRDVTAGEALPEREAGTGFSYSNVGYNLLEILIEDVTGQSFLEYMRGEVFLPLGMESASFDMSGGAAPYPPVGYNLRGEPVPAYLYPSKASGGLFATAGDIARFLAAGMKDNPVLSAEGIERMYRPESRRIGIYGLVFEAYGLGHYIETLPNGLRSVSHGGQGSGVMTHFQAVPETGDAIVILTNSQRSWPFIARLLRDWARWRAFSQVGMERIIWGHYGLCAVIGGLVSASLLMVLGRLRAFRPQKRTGFVPLRVGAAALLLGMLLWCAFQKYLFISSVFPVLSVWLGAAVFVFSIALLFSALFQPVHRISGNRPAGACVFLAFLPMAKEKRRSRSRRKSYKGGLKMDHVVYLDAKEKELNKLLSGQKTMIIRGAAGRKMPYGRVFPGEVLWFVENSGDGMVRPFLPFCSAKII